MLLKEICKQQFTDDEARKSGENVASNPSGMVRLYGEEVDRSI